MNSIHAPIHAPIHASTLALASLFFAAACASPPSKTWDSLVIQERVELSYAAQLGPQGFEDMDSVAVPASTGSKSPESAKTDPGQGQFVTASIQMLQMSMEDGRRLLGQDRNKVDEHTGVWSNALFLRDAGLLESASAVPKIQALIRAGDATLIDKGKLALVPGQRVCYSHVNQTSYVKGFSYETENKAYIADPVVAVALSGIKRFMTLDADASGGHRLQLQIREVELQRPIPLFTSQTNALHRVTIQTPVYRRVQMDGVVQIAKGQLLFIATPLHRSDADSEQSLLLTLIECQTQK